MSLPSPMEKRISGDLEDGWQAPAPDEGLKSILFFQVHGLSIQLKGSIVDSL